MHLLSTFLSRIVFRIVARFWSNFAKSLFLSYAWEEWFHDTSSFLETEVCIDLDINRMHVRCYIKIYFLPHEVLMLACNTHALYFDIQLLKHIMPYLYWQGYISRMGTLYGCVPESAFDLDYLLINEGKFSRYLELAWRTVEETWKERRGLGRAG